MEHAPQPVDVTDPALLFRINKLFREGMSDEELYEATRGIWRVGKKLKKKDILAMAVYKGVIKAVYKIKSWESAETAHFDNPVLAELAKQKRNRWAFVGKVAPEPEHSRYINCSVAHLFRQGMAAPVLGINLDD
ncbi:MAG: hypothetical protein HZB23_11815 [Deltaproteobacteria bacterium]|nr:hypothetical protein [Deltaproteobacteria bacterium]